MFILEQKQVGAKVASGAVTMTASGLAERKLVFVNSAILARLFVPEDFGSVYLWILIVVAFGFDVCLTCGQKTGPACVA
jgi:hypothetical protein